MKRFWVDWVWGDDGWFPVLLTALLIAFVVCTFLFSGGGNDC